MVTKTYLIDFTAYNADRIIIAEGTLRVRFKSDEIEAAQGAKDYLKTLHPTARYIILCNTREEAAPKPKPTQPSLSINLTINIHH